MKRNYKIFLLGLLLAVASCSFTTNKIDTDQDSDRDQVLIELISLVLTRGHYSPKDINDNFSQEVYKDYLNGIDSRKRYFLESDLKD
ncbi:MAG: tail-specific protease, partial [Mesonia sp.]